MFIVCLFIHFTVYTTNNDLLVYVIGPVVINSVLCDMMSLLFFWVVSNKHETAVLGHALSSSLWCDLKMQLLQEFLKFLSKSFFGIRVLHFCCVVFVIFIIALLSYTSQTELS